MRQFLSKYHPALLTLAFAIVMVLFWVFPHVSLLLYQEQYQLFLFDGAYFLERIALPGGLADYVAEFCTQFNYIYVLGAVLLTAWMVLAQWLTWLLCRQRGASHVWYPLSFVPVILMWWYMSDPNVMLSLLVALDGALALMWVYARFVSRFSLLIRSVLAVLALPAAYWLLGPVSLVLALYMALHEVAVRRSLAAVGFALLSLLIAVATILVCARFLPYPLERLFQGLNYFRYPVYQAGLQYGIMVLTTAWPFIVGCLPVLRGWIPVAVQVVVLVGGGCALITRSYDDITIDLIEYDYLVRTHQWDALIEKGGQEENPSPMSVACVNFALSQKGQLLDRLFEFYQNGGEGLFPSFARDMTSPVPTGEIFFSLGMVNDARRYWFEAQEAIPNFRQSGRLTMRIAQCDIINGQYAVAEKYLRRLTKSLSYRTWAKEQLELLRDEAAINAHPVYGKARKYRIKQDFLFSDREMDQMLGLSYVHCYENRNAYEYLMAYVMTQCDMRRFMEYYSVGQHAGYTTHIPYAIQQGLVFHWTSHHESFQGMPWSIDPYIMRAMTDFIQAYNRNPQDPALSSGPLAKTFWHYMLVNKNHGRAPQHDSREIY